MDNLRNNLVSLYTALGTIEVKGTTNVKTLANCITFLEQMITQYDEQSKQTTEEPSGKEQAE